MLKDREILTLAISQTLVWAGTFYLFPATLLRWEASLGWSKPDIALAITLAVLASALGAPVAGKIVDRGHGPALMATTTALAGIGIACLSGVTALWQFYLIWVAVGIMMAGCLYDACFSLVTHNRGANAKRGIVTITLFAGFASTLSFPALHYLSEAFGWRTATLSVGLFVTTCVAPLQYLGASRLQGNRTEPPAAKTATKDPSVLRRPVFWILATALSCLALLHGAVLHHLLPLLSERHLPAEFAVLIASLIGPMQVAGRLIMVALQDRYASAQFMLASIISLAVSVTILLMAADTKAALILFVAFFGGAWGTISILRPLIARDILGQRNFGAKSGYMTMIFLSIAALSPYIGAIIWKTGGYDAMLTTLLGVATLGGTLFLAALKLSRNPAP